MSASQIRIEAVIAKELSKVWTCWTEPEHITKWNFASPDWHCPKAANNLTVGEKYFARMEAKDGSFAFDFEAIYDEVVDQKKLVYTMADGRQVTTNFETIGNSTKMTTVFEAEKQNSVEMQNDGWQSILNDFKNYMEEN